MTYLSQHDDTENVPVYQLRVNFNVDMLIPVDISLVCDIVDRINLGPVLCTYSRLGRKPALDPVTCFKIRQFCHSEGIYSTRTIEKFCKFVLRLNRSIQAEGMFFKLMDGLGYERFRHRGLPNILSELNLMGIAINIDKLNAKSRGTKPG